MLTRLTLTCGSGPSQACHFLALLAARLEDLSTLAGRAPLVRIASGGKGRPRRICLDFDGPMPPALLDEVGTHVLHAPASEGRNQRRRWLVEVLQTPVDSTLTAPASAAVANQDAVVVRPCRSRGPGGQNTNKRSTAIHLWHGASGIHLRVESERTQARNRSEAHALLAARLAAMQQERSAATKRHLHTRVRAVQRCPAHRYYRLDARSRLELQP